MIQERSASTHVSRRRADLCLSWGNVGLFWLIGLFALVACSGGSGGGTSAPDPVASPPPAVEPALPVAIANEMHTSLEASAFLMRASFGGAPNEINALIGLDAADWLETEFAKPPTLYFNQLLTRQAAGEEIPRNAHSDLFWEAMITADDQLRQRMVFALSQILVVSDEAAGYAPLRMAYFMDVLSRNAFGNYRDLLEDVTYSPAMAEYLTYLRNRRANERSGIMPDENFAREIMQLFTIGLVLLNPDGTVQTDPNGQPIETYTNEDVIGLARVFTGMSLKGTGFTFADPDGQYAPLMHYPEQHSIKEKTFLGTTIPAGTNGEESVAVALDTLFQHPNVGPFLARQLIQRFTSSHPSPDYVERVATAFETGLYTSMNDTQFGTGQRGDLTATLAAILLDDSLGREERQNGKVREPVLRFVHWARAFETSAIDPVNEVLLRDTSDFITSLGQHPFRAPSVFNFYRPGFIAPGTETGDMDLTAPEFQIVNETSAIGYFNIMTSFVLDASPPVNADIESFRPDYTRYISLADTPEELVLQLDEVLTAGRLSDHDRMAIVETVNNIPLRNYRLDADRLDRVELAVLLITNSSAYSVIF